MFVTLELRPSTTPALFKYDIHKQHFEIDECSEHNFKMANNFEQVLLRNQASQALTTFTQPSIDPRQWAPGSSVSVSLSFTVPSTLATGSYQVLLNLPDASSTLNQQPLYRILFANTVDSNNVQVQDPTGTRYNVISSVNVV